MGAGRRRTSSKRAPATHMTLSSSIRSSGVRGDAHESVRGRARAGVTSGVDGGSGRGRRTSVLRARSAASRNVRIFGPGTEAGLEIGHGPGWRRENAARYDGIVR